MEPLEKTVRICNRRGLHARAAAKFVKMVEKMGSEITVIKDGTEVCGTSIMGLLMLSASIDTSVTLRARGEAAAADLLALTALIERRFDEEE